MTPTGRSGWRGMRRRACWRKRTAGSASSVAARNLLSRPLHLGRQELGQPSASEGTGSLNADRSVTPPPLGSSHSSPHHLVTPLASSRVDDEIGLGSTLSSIR